jgi:UPF0755 protein
MRTASTVTKFLAVAIAIVAVAATYLLWTWNRPLHPGSETYLIKPGTGLYALANELARRGTLRDTRTFILLGRLTLSSRDIKAGEYLFRDRISARGILTQVAAGDVVEYPLRIGEGATFYQVLAELAAAPKLTHTLNGLSFAQIMAKLDAPGVHPEGRFYPDTYFYTTGNTDITILRRAYDNMRQRLQREWESRDPNLPLRSADEALTLASIVEKETGKTEERPLIAGVFINRLRRGIRLQTDPTIIYGLGPAFDGNLRRKDLLADGPYNSYTRKGLPPTPIAMPSGAAIYAALHPANTKAIYFVSRGDGSHVFSETLEEHNRAVAKYQLKIQQ